jgi:hypothetical protein
MVVRTAVTSHHGCCYSAMRSKSARVSPSPGGERRPGVCQQGFPVMETEGRFEEGKRAPNRKIGHDASRVVIQIEGCDGPRFQTLIARHNWSLNRERTRLIFLAVFRWSRRASGAGALSEGTSFWLSVSAREVPWKLRFLR